MKPLFRANAGAGKAIMGGIKEIISLINEHIPHYLAKNPIRAGAVPLNTKKTANIDSASLGKNLENQSSLPTGSNNLHETKFESPVTQANSSGQNPQGNATPRSEHADVDGDPVSLCTGEELLTISEGSLPGLLPFTWQRFYRTSACELDLGLGYGWSHSLSHRLHFTDDTIVWHNDENQRTPFPYPNAEHPILTNVLGGAVLALGSHENEYCLTFGGGAGVYTFVREGEWGRLTALSDKYHNRLQLEYDRQQRLIHLQHAQGRLLFQYTDDDSAHIAQVHLQALIREEAYRDAVWVTQQVLAHYTYNAAGQLASALNACGEQEHYQYNEAHVITQRQLAGGACFNWAWEGVGPASRCIRQYGNFAQLDTRYLWDDNQRQVTLRRCDGSQEIYQYDGQARLIFRRAANGAEIRHTYNEEGLRVSTTDALGQQTRYFYDDAGNLVLELSPDGSMTRYTYLDGQLKRVAKGSGRLEQVWLNSINEHGDIYAARSPGEQVTEYDYFPNGQMRAVTHPDGVTQTYRWDNVGRLLESTTSGGSVRRYRYTPLGTQPIAVTDEAGNTTHFVWDALERLLEQTTPDGRTQQYRYNAYGKVTESRDPAGLVTRYEYAAPLHLLTRKILPDGSTLEYRYDNTHLQVSEILNPKGESYRLAYTATGLLSEEIGFDGVKTAYAYDLNDRLIEKQEYGNQPDAEPLVTTYQRDWQGKLLRKTLPDGQVEQYDYDALGRLIAVNDGQTPLAWEYDIANRLVAEHQGWATQRYQYDPHSGLLKGSRLPDGQQLGYHYQHGRVQGITLNEQPLLAFNHDNAGREQERRQGNGLVNRYQYDSLGRMVEHRLQGPGEMGLQPLWEQHYRYQAQGELASITGNAPREYGYDARGQLLSAQFPGSHTAVDRHSVAGENFLYDGAGNRVSEHGERDSAPGNRLAFFGDRHFEYDRFGNLAVERRGKAHKLVTTFAYDCRHRLIKRTDPHGQVTTYTYDAFNRRTSKTVEGQTTEYLWQGNKLIAETDNQQHWQTFLYEPGSHRPMATIVGSSRVNSPKVRTYWYQNDHLGTPHSLTDNQGNTVWRGQYSAYGQLTEEWTPPDARDEHPQPKVNNPLRFQGQYEDAESGLYYNLNRYYDPGIGRYLTADPIKLAGGLNLYQYVDGNPVGWVDPLGLFKQDGTGFDNAVVEAGETPLPSWKGSGPTSGVLGLEPASKSSGAVRHYSPPANEAIEYVFDPKTGKFAVGRPKDPLPLYSPHENLAEAIKSDRTEVLGGMFRRGQNGEFLTNEHSGHYGERWTLELRDKFVNQMKEYGIDVKHQRWKNE